MPSSDSDRHLPCGVVNFALSCESEKHEPGGGGGRQSCDSESGLDEEGRGLPRGQSEALHMGVSLGRPLSQPVGLWEVVVVP